MASSVFVELKATTSEFMAKMGAARAEVEHLSTKGSGHFQQLAAVGKGALLGVASAAAVVGIASIKLAGDFQQSMTQLVTGAGEAKSNMGLVSAGILDLSTKVGYSATELAKGMYQIESAGYHGAAGLNVLKAAAEGARAGNADMATVADALTTALNAYHLPASNAIAVTNELIATEQSGKLTMEDLAGSLGSVVPAASVAGLSLQQVLGAIATMTSTGTSANNATTYLRQTILQLSNPTRKAAAEMQSLGLSSIDVSKNLGTRGLTGTLDLLTAAITRHMGPQGTVLIANMKAAAGNTTKFQQILANLPATQQTYIGALADMVGGTKSMQAALELTGGNAKTFAANVAHVSEAAKGAGSNVTDWALVQKNFNLQLANAENALKKLLIELGMHLIPVVEKLAIDMAKLVMWFQKHTNVAKALGIAVGTVLVAAIALYIKAQAEAAAATIAANWEFLLIVAAIAAVAVGIYELYKHWDTVWKFIKRIVDDAVTFIKSHLTEIGIALIILGGPLLGLVGVALIVYDHWRTIWGAIRDTFTTVAHALTTAFSDTINFIIAHAKLILAIVFPVIGLAIDAIWTHWSAIWGAIRAVFRLVIDGIKLYIDNVLLPELRVIAAVITWLYQTVWAPTWRVISAAVGLAWKGMSAAFGFIINLGIGALHTAISDFETVWSGVWSMIIGAVNWAWGMIQPVLNTIKQAIADTLGPVKDVVNTVGKIGGAVGGGISSAGKSVGGFFGIGASGGIVTRPTHALIGEAGPEMVVPLNQTPGSSPLGALGGGSGDLHVHLEVGGTKVGEVVLKQFRQMKSRGVSLGLT